MAQSIYTDGATFSAQVAGNTVAFVLHGGEYGVFAVGGACHLDILGPDGSTWVPVVTLAAAGYQTVQMPPGSYRFSTTTATSFSVSRIKLG